MAGILDGVRVLDLSRYAAGPFCATVLAEMGAEVIRLEAPGGAEDRRQGPVAPSGDNLRYLMMGRNKLGITLDLEKPRGRELFHRLVERSDVVLDNFSPPVKKKLGLTYEVLEKINPKVILTTVSAFGNDGPYQERLGFDPIAQAESGSMSYTGFPGNPPTRAQVAWVDLSTGLHAALGTVLALYHRQRTGRGQQVEAALLDTAVSYVSMLGVAAEYQTLGQTRPQLGNSGYYTFGDTFQCRDGYVMLAIISNPIWKRLAQVIGQEQWGDDPRFLDDTSRWNHRSLIREAVGQWAGQKTVTQTFAALGEARIPCGRVNSVPDMVRDPHVKARGLFVEVPVPGNPKPMPHPRVALKFSNPQPGVKSPAPQVGQHNHAIYCGLLGLSPRDLEELQQQGVV